jgi:hypothetical protein
MKKGHIKKTSLEDQWLRFRATPRIPEGGYRGLAKELDTNQTCLSRFFSGEQKGLSFSQAVKLATKLNIDLSEIQIIVRKRQESEKGK